MLFKRVGKILLVALVGGVIMAVAALPATALATWAINLSAVSYDDLPEVLKKPTISQASYLYANDGTTLITTFYDENRRNVRLDQVAQVMRDAVVAAEDSRFYDHHGVDLKGIVRAAVANSSSENTQGASTLTMQYVRNVLKSDPTRTAAERAAATEVTPARKIQEARYAMALEQHLSKEEILERYLNIAYFGSGAYGVDAASHIYFSKDPSQLTLAEAATLAGMLQSPEAGGVDRALTRRNYTLNAMVGTGAITAAQAAEANAVELVFTKGSTPNNCVAAQAGWGFFCDYFRQWWDTQSAFGESMADRQQALRQGGYKIVTTLDPTIQTTALEQVHSVYANDNKFVAPMAVVQPGTGKVLALAVNRDYGQTFDQLIAGGNGLPGYQAGSTFKMFAMLAALEAGLPLDTGFNAPTQLVTKWPQSAPGKNNCDGNWCITNANSSWMDGYRTMWDGFGRSVNTYFVWLHQQIGAQRTVEMAKRLGIKTDDPGTGSFVIGTAGTFPLDLANAYATLAADGKYCTPLPVQSIADRSGEAVEVKPNCQQVISPDVARAATDAARCPVGQQGFFGQCNGGTATSVDGIMEGRPIAGKTGSTDDGRTESFVAFTPELAAAMIAANPKEANDGVGNAIISKVYRAVANALAASLEGQPEQEFARPSDKIAFGSSRERMFR
ncbi:MAG TPA: glycosyl transferase [Micromonosporaceae bacterium]|nr:glycosyl transferase [Micromonosporaceae bacterium]HCU51829.1 glycosyl transferase [Micromonosporaceae bacterium]